MIVTRFALESLSKSPGKYSTPHRAAEGPPKALTYISKLYIHTYYTYIFLYVIYQFCKSNILEEKCPVAESTY